MTSIRRQRGYQFEKYLTDLLNDSGWRAWRLGAPTTELPDILAVNNKKKKIVAIECKSTSSNLTMAPSYQIERCINVVNDFKLYEGKAILAYKFAAKIRIGGKYVSRKIKYYYYEWDINMRYANTSCNYGGKLHQNGELVELNEWKI